MVSFDPGRDALKIAGLIFGSLRLLGGYEVFTYNLLSHLARRDHDVTLYLPYEEVSRYRAFYEQLPMRVRGLAVQTALLFRTVPWVLQACLAVEQRRHRYDVWQVVGAYPAGYLAAGLNPGVPTVLRTYGDDVQVDASIGYGVRLEEPAGTRVARTVRQHRFLVAMSEALADCYRELEVPEEKIISIPNGIDHARLAQPGDHGAVRRKLGLRDDVPTLLTVGRNHHKKGYHLIPTIARRLREQGLAFEWLIVGKGADELQPDLAALGLTDCVHTYGEMGPPQDLSGGPPDLPTPELVALFGSADILVHPSFIEGFPRVLAEGMAAGCAIVTTDAPGCRDVISHGITGCVAPVGNAEEIAGAVARMITRPEERARLAAAGLEHARKFDWSEVVSQYETIYRRALDPSARHESV